VDLGDACELVPYLHDLGVSDLYLSPFWKARRGSEHGYDVIDPGHVDPAVGGDEGLDRLADTLHSEAMGLLADVIPNHMAADPANPWWRDVLEYGRASPYAGFFDIDWSGGPTKAGRDARILLPVLEDTYDNVVEAGLIGIERHEGEFRFSYRESRYPVRPGSYHLILRACLWRAEHLARGERARLARACERIAPAATPRAKNDARVRGEKIKAFLAALCRESPRLAGHIDVVLGELGDELRDAGTAAMLHEILEAQPYRLCHWRLATQEINYRRFFDINDLVGIRIERAPVFNAVHSRLKELLAEHKVTGVRVDHIDGLCHPRDYLERLHEGLAPPYVVVEKILAGDERIPGDWAVDGTTGYEFLAALNRLFVEPEGYRILRRRYRDIVGVRGRLADVTYARKKKILIELFAAELRSLGEGLADLAAEDPHGRDIPVCDLERALVELTACLPVYRTYIEGGAPDDDDRRHLEDALAAAGQRNRAWTGAERAFRFLRRLLDLDAEESDGLTGGELENRRLAFILEWQKLSGPVMAKGFEDTALYVFNALVSLNEVGGDADRSQIESALDGFHSLNQRRVRRGSHGLSATTTHDTKRSEDVRARINVLSEMPDRWYRHLESWRHWNRRHQRRVGDAMVPRPNEEVLLYQTLLGAWPLQDDELEGFADRLEGYLIKAAREAKAFTRWRMPDAEHERALVEFAKAILTDTRDHRFRDDFLAFQREIAYHGALNSLSQVALKVCSPGVPDFYQGTEVWNFSLVDPDNRRPVDFDRRQQLLQAIPTAAEVTPEALGDLLRRWRDGRVKLFLTHRGLEFRARRDELFRSGAYLPLAARGPRGSRVCAFARHFEHRWVVVVVPRWTVAFGTRQVLLPARYSWRGTELLLPRGVPERWRDVLTGRSLAARHADNGRTKLALGDVLAEFPVAILDGDAG
jgi:(1->4)-alpha-D-glucan 1-alpha-D-glucosylmutase